MLPTQMDTCALYCMCDSLGSRYRAYHCAAMTCSAQELMVNAPFLKGKIFAVLSQLHSCESKTKCVACCDNSSWLIIYQLLSAQSVMHYSIFPRMPFSNHPENMPKRAPCTCLPSTSVKRGAMQSREQGFQERKTEALLNAQDVSGCTALQYVPLRRLSAETLVTFFFSFNISAEKQV